MSAHGLAIVVSVNYNNHSGYSEGVATTIQIDEGLRDKIKSFGVKGETYNDIIARLYALAVEHQLKELLLSPKNAVPIDDAIARAEARWQS